MLSTIEHIVYIKFENLKKNTSSASHFATHENEVMTRWPELFL